MTNEGNGRQPSREELNKLRKVFEKYERAIGGESKASREVMRDRCNSDSPQNGIFMAQRKKRHVELAPIEYAAFDDVTRCVSDKCKKNWNQLN